MAGYKYKVARRFVVEVEMTKNDGVGGLRIMARRDSLTEANWFELLEERRGLIEPHLREMTLKSLGDLEIIFDYKGGQATERPLRMGAMVEKTYNDPPHHKYRETSELKTVEGPFKLETRGIWPDDEKRFGGEFKWEHIFEAGNTPASGRIIRFWGLTRNNEWLKAECTERYFEQLRRAGRDDRPERRSEVVKFTTATSTPEEICQFIGTSPQRIWQRLGDVAKAWLEHRQFLLAVAEELVEVIGQEEKLLSIIE